jgi:hypothetical protein
LQRPSRVANTADQKQRQYNRRSIRFRIKSVSKRRGNVYDGINCHPYNASYQSGSRWGPVAKVPRQPDNQSHARSAAPQNRKSRASKNLLEINDAWFGFSPIVWQLLFRVAPSDLATLKGHFRTLEIWPSMETAALDKSGFMRMNEVSIQRESD